MRVVDRKTFLTLPAGTVYCKGQRWSFEGLCFKGETAGNDWWHLDPAWVDGESSDECFDRLEDMHKNGASYMMQQAESRDGLYDEDALFLVFEEADLMHIRELIKNAIEGAHST